MALAEKDPLLEAKIAASMIPSKPIPPLAPSKPKIDAVLADRGKTHGSFADNARIAQAFKRVMHGEPGWANLTEVQRESAHMILSKLGRILSGNPDVHDHWDDIAGYAKLASDSIPIGGS